MGEQPLKTEDGQVQPDSQTNEPVADAGVGHNQLEQEVQVGDHHAVHNQDHMHHQQDQGSHGHDGHIEHHGHSHDPGHGHSHQQDHRGHGHGHSHDGHGHEHDHHEHSHGHGHSHDHEGHDHSHGIGHLGRKPTTPRPEVLPDSYKPAQQDFELPLSARFGSGSTGGYGSAAPSNNFAPPASDFNPPAGQQDAPSSTFDQQNGHIHDSQFPGQASYSDDRLPGQFGDQG